VGAQACSHSKKYSRGSRGSEWQLLAWGGQELARTIISQD